MSKFWKYVMVIVGLDIILFLLLALKPVATPGSLEDCQVIEGSIDSVLEVDENKLLIRLQDDPNTYSLSREASSLSSLTMLLGQEVKLYTPNYWPPLKQAKKRREV